MRNTTSAPAALDAALTRATPLLRVGRGLAKLESSRPTGGADDRALPLWDSLGLAPGSAAAASGSMGAALAGAAWARARGVDLHQTIRGPLTHEGRKSLELFGLPFRSQADAASGSGPAEGGAAVPRMLPPLDGVEAARVVARTLGAELLRELEDAGDAPAALIAPAGAPAALLGVASALRQRWPRLRVVALVAAGAADVLPELPLLDALDGAELIRVTRTEAAAARAWLSKSFGLLAGHAAARAVHLAGELPGLALVTSTGEREFSLDARGDA